MRPGDVRPCLAFAPADDKRVGSVGLVDADDPDLDLPIFRVILGHDGRASTALVGSSPVFLA